MRAPVFSAALLVAAVPLLASSSARADCPPGAWFCADVTTGGGDGTAPAPAAPERPAPSPPAGERAVDEPKRIDAPPGAAVQVPPGGGGTTIIIQAPPPATTDGPKGTIATPPGRRSPPVRRVYSPPPTQPPPRQRVRPRHRQWGFDVHLVGAMMGGKGDQRQPRRADDAGMGGLGFILRYRPIPAFALDFGLDFVGGRDYQGYRRSEVPFMVNGLFYVNPRNPVQFYFLGGLGWSGATVERVPGAEERWSYFGMQGGVGLEVRATQAVSFHFDVLGFLRGRTDDAARVSPEFVDPTTGRATNSSGGGLLRAGVTWYW